MFSLFRTNVETRVIQSPPEANIPIREEIEEQTKRILASRIFEHSGSNRRLLEFLSERAWLHPGESVKEYELATEAFGLPLSTFDPRVDSTVRVKVGRLRTKLAEYYAQDGIEDRVLFVVPKGTYYLQSSYRHEVGSGNEIESDGGSNQTIQRFFPAGSTRSYWVVGVLAFLFGSGSVLGIVRVVFYPEMPRISPVVRRFWDQFHDGKIPTVLVFSNPRLAGAASKGNLHYYSDEDKRSDTPLNLTYAGSGDVRSVRLFTQLFDSQRWSLGLESGALLSWDTAKKTDLIFIGRPEQNPALHELPTLHEFYFQYNVGIVSAHPLPGESALYGVTYSQTEGFVGDHAVVAFIPGTQTQQRNLVLAGNTTLGSQAAVECMLDDHCLTQIFERLGVKAGDPVPYFEALLQVQIRNHVPVWSKVVTVHRYPNNDSSWTMPELDKR